MIEGSARGRRREGKREAAGKPSVAITSLEAAKAALAFEIQPLIEICKRGRLAPSLAAAAEEASSTSDCAIIEADGMDIGE